MQRTYFFSHSFSHKARSVESRKAHSAENYCRGLIFARSPPGVKFPRAFHFETCCVRAWNSLSAAGRSELAGRPVERNKKKETDRRRIYGRCQTKAELHPLLLERFSSRRFIGWRRIDRLRDPIIINLLPSLRLFCPPRCCCLTFSFVCSFVGVEWDREGVGR